MNYGIFFYGERPKSKKQVKELVASKPQHVLLENTAPLFNSARNTIVTELPEGEYSFVGPDPFTKRNFYGTLKVSGTGSERTYKVS